MRKSNTQPDRDSFKRGNTDRKRTANAKRQTIDRKRARAAKRGTIR